MPYKYLEIEVPGEGIRRVRVPHGLRRMILPAYFQKRVFDEVLPYLAPSAKGDLWMNVLNTDRGYNGKIIYKVINGNLYWGFVIDRNILACGKFISSKPKWAEQLAAALPEARGKGLYRAVLKILREDLGRPLISDWMLTDANILIWSKIGKIDEAKNAFKINPRPKIPSVVTVAWSIVAMEAK